MKKNKNDLKKEARQFGIRVSVRVPGGGSRDASKEEIIANILEKKLAQNTPGLQKPDDGNKTTGTSKVTIHDKFRLINVIFSDALCQMALQSGNVATRAELDAGLVNSKAAFWQAVEKYFNEGFDADGSDGPVHADLLQHQHPLFYQGE